MADIRWLREVSAEDAGEVGRENSLLGETGRALEPGAVRIADGFAITASAHRRFFSHLGLDERVRDHLDDLDSGFRALDDVAGAIRALILSAPFPDDLEAAIREAYARWADDGRPEPDVALRASLIDGDRDDDGLAGLCKVRLDVRGLAELLDGCRTCYAHPFSDRALADRGRNGLRESAPALSLGVQRGPRPESAGTCRAHGSARGAILVTAGPAGGGAGDRSGGTDRYLVSRPPPSQPSVFPIVDRTLGSEGRDPDAARILSDEEARELARCFAALASRLGRLPEIEWVKEADSGTLVIVRVRTRPAASRSRAAAGRPLTPDRVAARGAGG